MSCQGRQAGLNRYGNPFLTISQHRGGPQDVSTALTFFQLNICLLYKYTFFSSTFVYCTNIYFVTVLTDAHLHTENTQRLFCFVSLFPSMFALHCDNKQTYKHPLSLNVFIFVCCLSFSNVFFHRTSERAYLTYSLGTVNMNTI